MGESLNNRLKQNNEQNVVRQRAKVQVRTLYSFKLLVLTTEVKTRLEYRPGISITGAMSG